MFFSLFVCPVWALMLQSLDLETSFFLCRYMFRMSWSLLHMSIIWSRSQEQKKYVSVSLSYELQNIYVKVEYQGRGINVKVIYV